MAASGAHRGLQRRFVRLGRNGTASQWRQKEMDKNRLSAVAAAAAAASLFLAGCAAPGGGDKTTMADAGGSVKVKCYGANACKGQAECKTAANACKGQNACKAQGYVMLTEQACIDRLGRA
jgi:hypothetical protein